MGVPGRCGPCRDRYGGDTRSSAPRSNLCLHIIIKFMTGRRTRAWPLTSLDAAPMGPWRTSRRLGSPNVCGGCRRSCTSPIDLDLAATDLNGILFCLGNRRLYYVLRVATPVVPGPGGLMKVCTSSSSTGRIGSGDDLVFFSL